MIQCSEAYAYFLAGTLTSQNLLLSHFSGYTLMR